MSQYRFWGSSSHMSADLKATTARVRKLRPEYFAPEKTTHTQMDGEGRVTSVDVADVHRDGDVRRASPRGIEGRDPVKHRKYRSGTGWCFWRWSEVDSEYITRLHLLKTPWFAICLHWLNKPDPEPFLHDHPVTFLSIILRGGYTERRWNPSRGYHIATHRWFNWIYASTSDRHTISAVRPRTLTLCLMGPKRRDWGFTIPQPVEEEHETGVRDQYGAEHAPGWEMWKNYYARQRAAREIR